MCWKVYSRWKCRGADLTVNAGQVAMMPPHVNMTGFNRSSSDPLRSVAFYVSEPDTPFLDPIQ